MLNKRKLLVLKDDDGEGPISYISVPADMMLDDARLQRWMRAAEVYADETPAVFHADNFTDLWCVFQQEFPKHMERLDAIKRAHAQCTPESCAIVLAGKRVPCPVKGGST